MAHLEGLQYVGSFQHADYLFESENPLEEVWSRVSQLTSDQILKRIFEPTSQFNNWDDIRKYASIRMSQAVSFRDATREGSTLTKPLTLYYSFLNLTRACLALLDENKSAGGHGLQFIDSEQGILSCTAKVNHKGTFRELIKKGNVNEVDNLQITLKDALSRVVELSNEINFYISTQEHPNITPITVYAEINGPAYLSFPKNLPNFRERWEKDYPQLKECCVLCEEKNNLSINKELLGKGEIGISNFCRSRLWNNLLFSDLPKWYILRQSDNHTALPRYAYYFIASFILSSIVRYEPEMLYDEIRSNSSLNWMIHRYLTLAERYYPHLMLNFLYEKEFYF